MTELLVASRNPKKLAELRRVLDSAGVALTLLSLEDVAPFDEAPETGATFEENALAKARWFSRLAPGRIVLADDSGLLVDALGGRPGVASKRWSNRPDLSGVALDEENNATLLRALGALGEGAVRTARYRCAAVCLWPGGELVAVGETAGEVLREARGQSGFGYDPYFFSYDLGRTFAEATSAEKEAVSHRGRAFRTLLSNLRARLAEASKILSWPVDRTDRRG